MSDNCDEPDCEEALGKLHSYIDGEMSDAELGAMREHLQRCSPCGDAKDFEAALQTVVSSKCAEKIPEALKLRLLGMVSEPTQP
jgi:anti-sigma factor (TIGR02949 family)